MRTQIFFFILFSSVFIFANSSYAVSHLGYVGDHCKKRHASYSHCSRGEFHAYRQARGMRPAHRDYDLDMTTGDDNPYVHPDLQIN